MSEILSKEAWLAKRRTCVTATDIGAICGLNPWKSKLGVWLDKTSRAEPVVETANMKIGKALQGVVLDLYDTDTGLTTRRCGDTELVVCEEFKLAAATPDAEVPGNRIVEAKVVIDPRQQAKWGEVGSANAVPDYYFLQVVWQAMCLKQDVADLAAMFIGKEFRNYPILRGRLLDVEEQLKEIATQFWMDYVATDICPPVDASEEAASWLARQFPKNKTQLLLPASVEAEAAAAEYLEADALAEEYTIRATLAKNQMKLIIGENDGIEFADGSKAKWLTTKDSKKTDYEKVALHLKSKVGANVWDSVIAKYTKPVPGIRKFYAPKPR